MTGIQTIITIATVSLGTILTRFISFVIFPANKPIPEYIQYLGKVLPFGTTGMLVVYCLKNNSAIKYPHMLPEILSILFIIMIHKWKNNMLYSITGGTFFYMILVQYVFKI